MSYLLAFIVSAAVFALYMRYTASSTQKETVRDRLQRYTSDAVQKSDFYDDDIPHSENLINPDQEKSPAAQMMEGVLLLTGVNIEKARLRLQSKLTQAGITTVNGLIAYLFMKRVGLPLLSLLLAIPVYGAFSSPDTSDALKLVYGFIGLLLALLAVKGADIFVLNQTQRRKQVLTRSFPDALDLMLVCVESGLALDGALSRVCRELGKAHPEVTMELNRTRLELTLLPDRTVALQNLAERTGLVPFRSLTSALIQTEKFGTSLSDTLRVMSEDYRLTRLMVAENKAGRLPVMMTVPLILLMLPALWIIIMAPAVIRVFESGVMK